VDPVRDSFSSPGVGCQWGTEVFSSTKAGKACAVSCLHLVNFSLRSLLVKVQISLIDMAVKPWHESNSSSDSLGHDLTSAEIAESVTPGTPLSLIHSKVVHLAASSNTPSSVMQPQPPRSRPRSFVAVAARIAIVRSEVSSIPDSCTTSRLTQFGMTEAISSSVMSV